MKFFIDQHGCAKNQIDGEIIINLLTKKGLEQTFDAEEADLIVVNSCGFIESAKTESLNAVISARQSYPNAKILLAGCLAQRYADELHENLPEADGIFGNGDLSKIDSIIDGLASDERPVLVPEQKGVCCSDRNLFLSFPGSAYVKITEGCNNRCAFCAIPIIRGDLRSRNASDILDEIKLLVEKGVFELNLIGQDLAAYGTGADDNVFGDGRAMLPAGTPGSVGIADENHTQKESALCRLLKEISKISGEFRIRLLYIHPDHFNEDILPVIKADSRILPYFDIPFQSGDDGIIKSMRRVGSQEKYLALVSKIREFFPEVALRTTFLTGFPGESDEAAKHSLEFLEKLTPDWSGCFPYSKEDDTPAYDFENQVSEKIAKKRADSLTSAQAKITKERLSERTGKDYNVLIEEVLAENPDAPDEGLAIGRAWFQAPEVDGSVVVSYDRSDKAALEAVKSGRLVKVHVHSSGDVDLNGDFIGDSELNAKIKKSSLKFAQAL